MNARIILATAIIGATALASLVYAGKEGKENQQKNSTEWRRRTVSLGADLKCVSIHGGRS
jgi:gas vesicle protein